MCEKFQQGFLDQQLHTPFIKGFNIRGTNEDLCHIQTRELNYQAHERYKRCSLEKDINCGKIFEKAIQRSESRLQNCLSII